MQKSSAASIAARLKPPSSAARSIIPSRAQPRSRLWRSHSRQGEGIVAISPDWAIRLQSTWASSRLGNLQRMLWYGEEFQPRGLQWKYMLR